MRYVTSIERLGREEGILLGRQEGLEEGKEMGVEENLRQNVISLRNNLNLSAEQIAQALEVPLDKVQQLLSQTSH